MPSPIDITVVHNAPENRFEALVDGELSVAEYAVKGNTWIINHTYVPLPLRGRGIAEKLVRTALDRARAEGKKVVPQCSYVDLYIQRHAAYRDLVA